MLTNEAYSFGTTNGTNSIVPKRRSLNYDLLRICAAAMVVLLHVASSKWRLTPVETTDWAAMNLYDSLARCAVPLFFMLNGAFVLKKDIEVKVLFFKKILPLCVVWLVWSFLYAVDDVGIKGLLSTDPEEFFSAVVGSHYHLWFIPTLAGIYILQPILRSVVAYRDGICVRYFLLIFFFFGIARSTFGSLVGNSSISVLVNKIPVDLVKHPGYMVLGYCLANSCGATPKKGILISGFLICVSLCALISQIVSAGTGFPSDALYGNFSLTTFVESICVFLLFKGLTEFRSEICRRAAFGFSKLTFGIYLIHPFVISHLEELLDLSVLSYSPVLSIPINTVLVILVSALITAVFIRVPGVKRLWVL